MDPRVPIYRIGAETNPRGMLVALAHIHGIGPQVEKLLENDDLPDVMVKDMSLLLTSQRKLLNLSAQDVHTRCNISRSQVGHYEGGNSKNPGLRTLAALSYGYKLPFVQLLLSALQEVQPRATPRKRRTDE